jgi:hypothetical protein
MASAKAIQFQKAKVLVWIFDWGYSCFCAEIQTSPHCYSVYAALSENSRVQIGFCRSCLLDTVHGQPLYSRFSESLQEFAHHPLQGTAWPIVSKKTDPEGSTRMWPYASSLGVPETSVSNPVWVFAYRAPTADRKRLLLGPVAENVFRNARVSVLVVPIFPGS